MWKGKDHTIYVPFGGPSLVQDWDGSYSVGPNTRCGMVLLEAIKQPAPVALIPVR
jgi:hypothetical protein